MIELKKLTIKYKNQNPQQKKMVKSNIFIQLIRRKKYLATIKLKYIFFYPFGFSIVQILNHFSFLNCAVFEPFRF